jgi:hypothetical protein
MAGAVATRLELDRLQAGRDSDGPSYVSVLDLGKSLRLSRWDGRTHSSETWVGSSTEALAALSKLPDGAGVETVARVLAI